MESKTFHVIKRRIFFMRVAATVGCIALGVWSASRVSVYNLVEALPVLVIAFIALPVWIWHNSDYFAVTAALTIGPDGVEYCRGKQRHFLKWDEIHFISVDGSAYRKLIYINGGDINLLFRIKKIKDFNEVYFGAELRPKLIHEIQKHWDKPIQGIY